MIEYENLGKLNASFAEGYRKKFDEIVDNGQFILGDHVRQFESQFAHYCGSKYCVGVGNGSDALLLALRSFAFEPGAEVIVAANTYIASVFSILNGGLRPFLVEPDLKTYTLDPKRIEEAITKKTVAIMPVHLYGQCCAMDEIMAIAKKYDLKVIEDCAQAHGAKFKGKKAGTFGDFGAFSFYPTKNLGALGDGGCLTTDQKDLMLEVETLRNYGSDKKYYNRSIGINSRLDELQAGFLGVKLEVLDAINSHKRKLALMYSEGLKEDFIQPFMDPDYFDVYHIYSIRHPSRDELRKFLLTKGIQTEIHYPIPPYQQTALEKEFKGKTYPISDEIHATTLSLPISFIHTEKDVKLVIETMNSF